MKHHNNCYTSFCDTWSAMTHNMRLCVQNWKEEDGDLTFLHETQQTTTATKSKCWDYCTCSGSCRGVELKGVLFSTLPRIYKHNTISPQRASLRLLHLCYSVSVTYAHTTKWTDWPLGEYFPKCPVLLNKPCTRFFKEELKKSSSEFVGEWASIVCVFKMKNCFTIFHYRSSIWNWNSSCWEVHWIPYA